MIKKNKNILLIEDVISAGTATYESVELLKPYNCHIKAIVIALDRAMEPNQDTPNRDKYKTAAQAITGELQIPIYSILSVDDISQFIK